MKILLIGGTGTISSAITRQLAEQGHELWLLNRGSRKQEVPSGVRQVICDVNDEAEVLRQTGDQQYDAVCEFIGFLPLQVERDIRLFDLKNVKGIKYTGRDFYACQRLKRMLDKETIWFAGCDELLISALAMGDTFSGGIGLNYNIIPRPFAKICQLCAQNDFRSAAKWQAEANRLVDIVIDAMKDNWSAFKVLMKGVGIDCGCCRAPYAPLTKAHERRLLDRFAKLGFVV